MVRGEDGQAARHRFEHRVGNAFLISVVAGLARVQENVRRVKDFAELRLRNESGKRNLILDLELAPFLYGKDRLVQMELHKGRNIVDLQTHPSELPIHIVSKLLAQRSLNSD